MPHVLESNEAERDYFGRANKNGKAAWRRIVRVTTGSLPTWAEVTTGKVTTHAVTTNAEVTTEPLPDDPSTVCALADPTDDDLNASLGFA